MSSSGWQPPPIRHPFHKSRQAVTRACRLCGREFHPWRGSPGTFCTPACAGMHRRVEAHVRRREERERARRPATTPEERARAASVAAECLAAYERVTGHKIEQIEED